MSADKKLLMGFLSEKGEATLPEIQKALSLPYKEVREGLSELVREQMITFEGGMTFRCVGKAPSGRSARAAKRSAPQADSYALAKVSRLIEQNEICRYVIEDFADDYSKTKQIKISRLQVKYHVGFARASMALDRLRDLDVITADGRIRLTLAECNYLLGRPLEEKDAEAARKGQMTVDDFRKFVQQDIFSDIDERKEEAKSEDPEPDEEEEVLKGEMAWFREQRERDRRIRDVQAFEEKLRRIGAPDEDEAEAEDEAIAFDEEDEESEKTGFDGLFGFDDDEDEEKKKEAFDSFFCFDDDDDDDDDDEDDHAETEEKPERKKFDWSAFFGKKTDDEDKKVEKRESPWNPADVDNLHERLLKRLEELKKQFAPVEHKGSGEENPPTDGKKKKPKK